MPCKESLTFGGPLAAVLLLSAALSACGSASGGSRAEFREDFRDVEINRIGDLRQSDVEFQNIAMRNAVRHAEGRQVPAAAVERITIVGNERVGPSLSNSKLGRPPDFGDRRGRLPRRARGTARCRRPRLRDHARRRRAELLREPPRRRVGHSKRRRDRRILTIYVLRSRPRKATGRSSFCPVGSDRCGESDFWSELRLIDFS